MIITILAIIGAITLLCLFCLTVLLVACHILYLWQCSPEHTPLTLWQGRTEQGKDENKEIVYSKDYKK